MLHVYVYEHDFLTWSVSKCIMAAFLSLSRTPRSSEEPVRSGKGVHEYRGGRGGGGGGGRKT